MVTVGQVRAMALALPETTEVLAWGSDLTWRVRDKIFVIAGPDAPRVTVRTSREEQRELCAQDPSTYQLAPYVGRYGWTSIQLSTVDGDELAEIIAEAWRRTAPKRIVAAYDAT